MAAITVDEYSKALRSLKIALDFVARSSSEDEFKIARDACIQRFEFSIELAWKVSAKTMGIKINRTKNGRPRDGSKRLNLQPRIVARVY